MAKRKHEQRWILGYGILVPASQAPTNGGKPGEVLAGSEVGSNVRVYHRTTGDVLLVAEGSIRSAYSEADVVPVNVSDLWIRRLWERGLRQACLSLGVGEEAMKSAGPGYGIMRWVLAVVEG